MDDRMAELTKKVDEFNRIRELATNDLLALGSMLKSQAEMEVFFGTQRSGDVKVSLEQACQMCSHLRTQIKELREKVPETGLSLLECNPSSSGSVSVLEQAGEESDGASFTTAHSSESDGGSPQPDSGCPVFDLKPRLPSGLDDESDRVSLEMAGTSAVGSLDTGTSDTDKLPLSQDIEHVKERLTRLDVLERRLEEQNQVLSDLQMQRSDPNPATLPHQPTPAAITPAAITQAATTPAATFGEVATADKTLCKVSPFHIKYNSDRSACVFPPSGCSVSTTFDRYTHVDSPSPNLDEDTGTYTTPRTGHYEFGVFGYQDGTGCLNWWVCGSQGWRENVGTTEKHRDWFDNKVKVRCVQGERVWMEVHRGSGVAAVMVCSFYGKACEE